MAATYEPIASTTLVSNAASVTFSSIPTTYTDLILVTQMSQTGTDTLFIRFNGSSASDYSHTNLRGNGTTASSSRTSNDSGIYADYAGYAQSSVAGVHIIQVMNYSNNTTNKTVLVRSNAAATGTDAIVGLWRNTAVINSITLVYPSGSNIKSGSTFSLYGIKAA